MKTLKGIAVFSAVLMVGLLCASRANADVAWRTPLTISEPTEVPGMVLEPGKYIVQVLNTKETRMVVQFLNEDGSKNITTVMAVPNYRVKVTDGSPFTYFQRSEGAPQALKDWFYVGNNFGIEFIYPKETAVRIARASNETVYSAPSARPEPGEQIVTISPEAKEVPLPPPPAAAPAPPPPPETRVAENPPPPPPAPERPAKLPATASNIGLLALAGIAALGIALTLRLSAR